MTKSKKPKKHPRQSSRLLSPETERAAERQPDSQPSEPGLLESLKEKLGSVFSSPQPSQQPSPAAADSSSVSSAGSATTSSLTPEAERTFAAVPDVIGDDPAAPAPEPEDAATAEIDAVVLSNRQHINALIDLGYFDVEDFAEILTDAHNALSEKFGSDHWMLKDRQREKLARPLTAIANGLMQSLFDMLPGDAGSVVSSHPEYTAFGLSALSVDGPKLIKQLRLKGRGASKSDDAPVNVAREKPRPSTGAPTTGNNALGIPEAPGKLG